VDARCVLCQFEPRNDQNSHIGFHISDTVRSIAGGVIYIDPIKNKSQPTMIFNLCGGWQEAKHVKNLFYNERFPKIISFSPTSPFGAHTLLLQIVKYTFNMVALDLYDTFSDRTAGTTHYFELLAHQC
jgi:hypothetical protein